MICPATRDGALRQLEDFLPLAPHYARDRSFVVPGHPAVSRLSPAIRHRLVSEYEVAAMVMAAHPFEAVEKFVQEVYWRRYWKSWLSLRPQVWSGYLEDLDSLGADARVAAVEAGASGKPLIDHFTRELVETGYLHNHSRMWYAGWWIHEAGLPWQAGAAMFLRHLWDGDPASNTLSWRWVAGVQTNGKTYLARRPNIERWLDPAILAAAGPGPGGFENPQPRIPDDESSTAVTCPCIAGETPVPAGRTGLWIHEEDLSPEGTELGAGRFDAMLATANTDSWDSLGFPETKRRWIEEAVADASRRAGSHWRMLVEVGTGPLVESLADWARKHRLRSVRAVRPDVGPIGDLVPTLRRVLAEQGTTLCLTDRAEDLQLRPLATAGFFPFWEKTRECLMRESRRSGSSETRVSVCR